MRALLSILFSALFAYTASASGTIQVESKTVKLAETFTVELPGNPSARLVWEFQTTPPALCRLNSRNFKQQNPNTPGSSGNYVFLFTATKEGNEELKFTQAGENPKVYQLQLTVGPENLPNITLDARTVKIGERFSFRLQQRLGSTWAVERNSTLATFEGAPVAIGDDFVNGIATVTQNPTFLAKTAGTDELLFKETRDGKLLRYATAKFTVTSTEPKKTTLPERTVTVGDVFKIDLVANSGTGFDWNFFATRPSSPVRFENKTRSRTNPAPGSPETFTFTFTALSAGVEEVNFNLARNSETVEIATAKITINAKTPTEPKYTLIERTVYVGENFNVDLVSNPGTGFAWSLINRDSLSLLKYNGDEKSAYTPGLLGGQQTTKFKFSALKDGVETLKFELKRGSEKPMELTDVRVTIRKSGGGDYNGSPSSSKMSFGVAAIAGLFLLL